MGQISKMDSSGDSKLVWDADNEVEVKAAKNLFDELKGKGYTAFSVKKDGRQNKMIEKFDPKAEKIILVPRIAGGK